MPTQRLDLRCEFDLPRFKNLTDTRPLTAQQDHMNFLWFQQPKDFATPSDPKKEEGLRHQILELTVHEMNGRIARKLEREQLKKKVLASSHSRERELTPVTLTKAKTMHTAAPAHGRKASVADPGAISVKLSPNDFHNHSQSRKASLKIDSSD